jgi:putative transposase
VTARVSPSERIRAEIDELLAGSERGSLLEHFEEVARAAVRLVFQTALEAEVTEFLGRERYARGEREREGSRNGYSDVTIRTTAGEVTLQRPKVRGTDEAFASRLLGTGVTRTNA